MPVTVSRTDAEPRIPSLAQKCGRRLAQFAGEIGRRRQLLLPLVGDEILILDRQLHAGAFHALCAHARGGEVADRVQPTRISSMP